MISATLAVMSITTDDYVTIISLGISLASIGFVIFFRAKVKALSKPENHNSEESQDNAIEVSAIVSEFGLRLKRLEENLVDQKVKLEILDLRVAKGNPPRPDSRSSVAQTDSSFRTLEEEPVGRAPVVRLEESKIVSRVPSTNRISQVSQDNLEKKLGITEMEALRIVFEGRGKISAKEIQQKIDRTREHTARMMSSLYREGLVERDVTARPFSYSITQKGRDLLNN
ncbi:MAG: hypothetical protein OK439_06530 [Thaumarchaeota archaeon]|nr:hypothetical protein [Nitrososphaerota archaeon]